MRTLIITGSARFLGKLDISGSFWLYHVQPGKMWVQSRNRDAFWLSENHCKLCRPHFQMGSNFICPQKPQKGDWVRVWRDPLGCETSLWAESLLAFRETKRERNKPSAKRSALRLEGLCFSNCTQGSVPRQQQDNWEWQDEGVGSPQAGSSHLPPKRLSSLLRRSHFAVWEGQPATVEPGKAWQAASP